MAFRRLFLLSVPLVAAVQWLTAQTVKPEPAKPPQLTLEIIPVKKAYVVGETLFVKYKLISLSDGTLCFPAPAIHADQSVTGYLTTVDIPPAQGADESDRFIEHFWERHPSEEKLRSDVENHWIKLGMSEPYHPKRSDKIGVLTAPGEWVLRSTYYPPQLNAQEKAMIELLGCTAADVPVQSSATITVMNTPR